MAAVTTAATVVVVLDAIVIMEAANTPIHRNHTTNNLHPQNQWITDIDNLRLPLRP